MNAIRMFVLSLSVAAAALGCQSGAATEPPAVQAAVVIPASAETQQLGVSSWELRDDGTAIGWGSAGQKAALFHSGADRRDLRSELPEVGATTLDGGGQRVQSTFPPAVERLHRALVADAVAFARSQPASVNVNNDIPFAVVCCIGGACGPHALGQVVHLTGREAGWCTFQPLWTECCGRWACESIYPWLGCSYRF